MAERIDPAILDRLTPVAELDPAAREHLARKAVYLELAPGEKLQAADTTRWMLYLLEGKVSLFSEGRPLIIEAHGPRAQQPVFGSGRLREYATALTESRLLRLDRNLYETLIRQQTESGYEIRETPLSEMESGLFGAIYQRIITGQLVLPALPEVAMRMQAAMNDPEIDAARLARIVQTDMAVTGGLLKAAKSARYGGSSPIHNVRDAIVRLGFDTTRQLVTAIALKQVFRTQIPAIRQRMHALWERSVHVSALSHILARHGQGFDAEHAMLAGLLHQVGMVPLLDDLARLHPDLPEEEREQILQHLHPVVGELVINDWGLDADIVQVICEGGRWDRNGTRPPDYCDVVLVAQLYYLAHSGDAARGEIPRYDQVPAYTKLGLPEPDRELKLDLFEEAREEIREVLDLLGASTA
ncbi:HD-like signal output (HDOD) domain, no enzymatic activity [Ectothiorhodospira mobilis]|uniref:HD-like signal output (HDOD) domain, no enzymatic activity n=1 Tax=Ectothiorhodospira mobilis TaxID=195064 RepID=A0A1I4S8G5_ECTMO|nr:HDOD domain-containing protein [Ectothiorhodospira mobilis]SFM60782.1 HD-like signal output (HDOD) domain, no enzymatic activity [Ectothiorhodospira mobilis]